MQHAEGTLHAHDGLELYHQSWRPEGDARAAIMLVHGLGEHSGRYGHVASALVDAGCAVYAIDHRGHGKSGGKRAFVNSYDEFMRDLDQFRAFIEDQQRNRPLIVLGHSMGGNLAVGHALASQDGIAGLALSAPALEISDDITPIKLRIFRLVAKVAPGIRPEGLDAETISRDPAVVEAYRNDPLVFTGKISAGLGVALFDAIESFPGRYREFRLPLLLMHGTADALVGIGGTKELEAGAVNADVTTHYYEGLYHEVFNEPEQDQVLADLVAWIDSVIA